MNCACTCSVVVYSPHDLGGGKYRSRWLCRDCGMEFVKYLATPRPTYTPEQVERLVRAARRAERVMSSGAHVEHVDCDCSLCLVREALAPFESIR